MKTIQEKPMVVHFNEDGMNKKINYLNAGAEKLQSLINENISLNLIKIKNTSELSALIRSGENYIRQRMLSEIETPSFGNLKMKPEELLRTISWPSFINLNSIIEECKIYANDLQYYQLENDKIIIPDTIKETIKHEHCLIARTPKQIAFAKAHLKAAEALKELQETSKEVFGTGINDTWPFRSFFYFDENNCLISFDKYRDRLWNNTSN